MDEDIILIMFADGGAIVFNRSTNTLVETFNWETDRNPRTTKDVFLAIPENQVYNGYLRGGGEPGVELTATTEVK